MSDLTKHYLQLVAIAKGWAIKNLAGWCDETHRDLLARHGACEIDGRISASSMNMPQLAAALEDYEKRGWPRQHKFSKGSGWTVFDSWEHKNISVNGYVEFWAELPELPAMEAFNVN